MSGAELNLAGEEFQCDPAGSLYWPGQDCLIVSDLHLEKGAASAVKGALVPPYDTGTTLRNLSTRLKFWQPSKVICLGDSFHRDDSHERLPIRYRAILRSMMEGREWIWIAGNHDPLEPVHLGGSAMAEIRINAITFRHEINSDEHGPQICGHLHPTAKIIRRGRRVRRRCFVSDGERMILPSFGAYTGGLDVHHEAFRGLFTTDRLKVWMLGREQIFALHGTQLAA